MAIESVFINKLPLSLKLLLKIVPFYVSNSCLKKRNKNQLLVFNHLINLKIFLLITQSKSNATA